MSDSSDSFFLLLEQSDMKLPWVMGKNGGNQKPVSWLS
jgi:hypothetical protein